MFYPEIRYLSVTVAKKVKFFFGDFFHTEEMPMANPDCGLPE